MTLDEILLGSTMTQSDIQAALTAQGYTEARAGYLDAIVSATTWQRHARVANDCVGTVWYVAVSANGGNDANDGLTPWTPKLTPKTVIEAALAGDCVLVGPGTFAAGNNGILLPYANIRICGMGKHITVLTSTVASSSAAIVNPSSNSEISNLDIVGLNATPNIQYPIGDNAGAFTNATLRNVYLSAPGDGIVLTNASSLDAYDLEADSQYDCLNLVNASAVVNLYNPTFRVRGPFTNGKSRGIVTQGTVRVYRGSIDSREGTGTIPKATYGVCTTGSGVAELYGVKIYTTATAGSVYDLCNLGGTIRAVGCDYDRTKTSGTITDIPSHSVDSNGLTIQAAANAALVANHLDETAADAEAALVQIALVDARLPATPAARGDEMALTIDERTTLAGVIWSALTSGLTTVGSVGKWLMDNIAAIKTQTDRIASSGGVTVVSGLAATGDLTIYQGDDYSRRSIQFTAATGVLPDISAATVTLEIQSVKDAITIVTVTATSATQTLIVFEPTHAQTALLIQLNPRAYAYRVLATWDGGAGPDEPLHLFAPGDCSVLW